MKTLDQILERRLAEFKSLNPAGMAEVAYGAVKEKVNEVPSITLDMSRMGAAVLHSHEKDLIRMGLLEETIPKKTLLVMGVAVGAVFSQYLTIYADAIREYNEQLPAVERERTL